MAATDYIIVTGWLNAYLVKKKKSTNTGLQTMSQDRRVITNSEMIGLFEFYLRNWCEDHGSNTVVITDPDENKIFEATLLDRRESVYKNDCERSAYIKMAVREKQKPENAEAGREEGEDKLQTHAFQQGEAHIARQIIEMIHNGWHLNAIEAMCNEKIDAVE